MAVSTDTMPDVVSLGFSNVATFTAQDSLLPLDDYLDQIETLILGKALCRIVGHLVLGAIDADDEKLRRMDLTVDPCVLSCYDKHLQ